MPKPARRATLTQVTGGAAAGNAKPVAYAVNLIPMYTLFLSSVGYDEATMAITLTSGEAYAPAGGELAPGDGKAKTASPTASKIYLDGTELNLTVYNIGGYNFFKLRDLMKAAGVYVGYDGAANAITLDTSQGYVDE